MLTKNSSTKPSVVQEFARKYNINYVTNPNLIISSLKFTSIIDLLNVFQINKLAKKYSTDIIWLGYGCMNIGLLKYFKLLKPKMKLICDTDSVQSRYFLRGLSYIKNKTLHSKYLRLGNSIAKSEKIMINFADITLAVSEVDQQYYQGICSNPKKIQLLYNALDIKKYVKLPDPGFLHPTIILTGWYGKGSPMEDGAKLVISKVWPLVLKEYPLAHLYLIGKGSTSTIYESSSQNIHVLGEVVDMVPYLTNADISVVPLRFESGTRFKILEASASMVPVVTTTLGVEGLQLTNETDILVADNPSLFAASIIRLLKNKSLRNRLIKNARTIINQKYSLKVVEKQARDIISKYICTNNLREGTKC